MVRRSTALYLVLIVCVATAWAAPAITQGPAVPESALLSEVRLLRQAIETLAGNGSRIQLVFGRLQLQEQRTTAAVRRLTEARSTLASHMVSLGAVANRLTELETSLSSTSHSAEETQAMQDALAHYKRESARLEAERVRLATEEADAAQSLSQEQARWSDINRQVEELERMLAQRR
jgi:DNA repair exonuclease SbcCD ATPase subunit